MKRRRALPPSAAAVALVLLLASGVAAAPGGDPPPRGWDYLIERLAAEGVPRERARAVFGDPRFEAFDGLRFGLAPHESAARYRAFLRPASVERARRCRREHAEAFARAERLHGVPASIVTAIVHVESACGRNTGGYRILPRLARLAMANEPANLQRNLERHLLLGGGPRAQIERATRERAGYLADTFYPEVRAVFDIAGRERLDPLALRGSGSGAFGIPQFLPTSYLRHGVDGDGDGRVDLFDPADAIPSCARYLAAHGWKPGMTVAERRRVLWAYNRSTAYGDAVLALAGRLGGV